jgi:hypothetical protein
MCFESDISENELPNGRNGHSKHYTKVTLKATEDEKRRAREMITKQKK